MSKPKTLAPHKPQPVAEAWFVGWLLGTAVVPVGILVLSGVHEEFFPRPLQAKNPLADCAILGQFAAQCLYCLTGAILLRGWRLAVVSASVLVVWITGNMALSSARAILPGLF